MIVLTLEAGPTSLAYHLWDMTGERDLASGLIVDLDRDAMHRYSYLYGSGRGTTPARSPADALARALESIALSEPSIRRIEGLATDVEIVAHVFGVRPPGVGSATRVTDDLLAAIDGIAGVLPGQGRALRASLEMATAAREALPAGRHVAVFDDAFYQTRIPEGACYPVRTGGGGALVRRLVRGGLRLGSVVEKALEILGSTEEAPRIVVCDLDGTPQVTSMRWPTVYDSTFEFDGSSRILSERHAGAVPPGLRDALVGAGASDAVEAAAVLGCEGGLSCIEDAPLTLAQLEVQAAEGIYGPACRMLFDQVVREVGGQMTLLGGLDALVFTGTGGLECPLLRSLVATRLRLFRISIDEKRNEVARTSTDITGEGSRVKVLVVAPAKARHVALLATGASGDGD